MAQGSDQRWLASFAALTVPGALLAGDDAGFLNVLKIKGSHTAMKSGMLAAEAAFEELATGHSQTEASSYQTRFENSGCMKSYTVRAMLHLGCTSSVFWRISPRLCRSIFRRSPTMDPDGSDTGPCIAETSRTVQGN